MCRPYHDTYICVSFGCDAHSVSAPIRAQGCLEGQQVVKYISIHAVTLQGTVVSMCVLDTSNKVVQFARNGGQPVAS